MSGFNASMIFSNSASSASTVSATLRALPFTRAPNTRACSNERLRGLGGKNTNPTASAPASSATSRVSGVESPQIFTSVVIAGRVLHGWRRFVSPYASFRSRRYVERPPERARKLSGGHRLSEQKSLDEVKTHLAYRDQIGARLHSLGDRAGSKASRGIQNSAAQCAFQTVLCAALHYRARHLEFGHRKAKAEQ